MRTEFQIHDFHQPFDLSRVQELPASDNESLVPNSVRVSHSPRCGGQSQSAHFGIEFDGLEALEWLVPQLPSQPSVKSH